MSVSAGRQYENAAVPGGEESSTRVVRQRVAAPAEVDAPGGRAVAEQVVELHATDGEVLERGRGREGERVRHDGAVAEDES